MKTYKFDTELKRPVGSDTWHYIDTPIDVEKKFGTNWTSKGDWGDWKWGTLYCTG